MNIFTEIKDLIKFLFKTSDNQKKIIFYAEHEGYYSYFQGIIETLTDKHQQPVCYITSDIKDPLLKNTRPLIKPFYFSILLPFIMSVIKCNVFIMTLTDLDKYHLKRSIHPVHYIYMFHSLVSIHMMYNFGAFDNYDTIFCCGAHHINEIQLWEEKYNTPKKHLIETGYYRLERIIKSYKNTHLSNSDKKTVLIAPSWGKDNIIESIGEALIDTLLKSKYSVILRPHPETVRRSAHIIEHLQKKYCENEQVYIELSVSSDTSLIKSDILLCDCSGVALEYAFGTERPVLFIDVPYKIKNPHYKEFPKQPIELTLREQIGKICSFKDIDAIPEIIENMMEHRKQYQHTIIELREKYMYEIGSASEKEAAYILSLI